ncbi:MAG TPA: hypothetical protein VNK70_00110 [Candidatus Paceibacterota bacterium]|nr:hypothetical protein [Candidatus Paceibacterota bacterium]
MYEIQVVVEGVGRGLLMHKFSVEASAELESELKKVKRQQRTPQDEAEQVAYRLHPNGDENVGQLCLPAEHFLGAIVNTGSSLQVKGRGKKTYKGAFKGQLGVVPDFIGLTDTKSKPLFTFKIDSRPVKIKATQGRIIRHRPWLEAGWRAAFRIQVGDDTIPLEVVQSALEEAGRSACVGDYRPRFGQFRIVSFEKV